MEITKSKDNESCQITTEDILNASNELIRAQTEEEGIQIFTRLNTTLETSPIPPLTDKLL